MPASMPTRKAFLIAGAVTAMANPRISIASQAAAPARPTPTPLPTARPSKISSLARALARSLQTDLPKAHLSDKMRDAIASDIQDNFAIGNAFRALSRENLPPPDFVFAASTHDRP